MIEISCFSAPNQSLLIAVKAGGGMGKQLGKSRKIPILKRPGWKWTIFSDLNRLKTRHL